MRDGLGRKNLQEIGERMLELKKNAPTSPAEPTAVTKAADAVIA
ncbi:MAG: hypothetical protein ACR2KL_10110 [Nocardioidaceae bacterium]